MLTPSAVTIDVTAMPSDRRAISVPPGSGEAWDSYQEPCTVDVSLMWSRVTDG
jgi:hypothetical protein